MSAADALFLQPTNAGPEDTFRGGTWRGETPAAQVVANWHDENHLGVFALCTDQPCEAVRRVDGGPDGGAGG